MLIQQLENVVEIITEKEEEEEQSHKILLIFPDRSSADIETKKLKTKVENIEDFYQYLEKKDYRVDLGREELEIIVEASKKVPPFFKMAWKNDTDRVIILK